MPRQKRTELDFLNAAAELWDAEPEIGYLARLFTQTSLPYKEPKDNPTAWRRVNGHTQLVVQPGVLFGPNGEAISLGYPFGSIPRLILTWVSTEAVRTQKQELVLGTSLTEFMRKVGLIKDHELPTGGKRGNATRAKQQMERLFRANISVEYTGDQNRQLGVQMRVASGHDLWWKPRAHDEQPALMESTVRLSPEFFEQIVEHPVPVDMAALRVLRESPLRLDIYTWLTYRMSRLNRQTTVPWSALKGQFGSELADTKQGNHQFKRDFKKRLTEVKAVYREANVDFTDSGLVLQPSRTHIPKSKDFLVLERGA
ncbi:replication protein RepA [Nocardia sp. NPDC059240]|uniref:replication protein RepA n=1 Tax=Nocardia sp. NPDC059240 TaxID=3346786 RepID=UPI003680C376